MSGYYSQGAVDDHLNRERKKLLSKPTPGIRVIQPWEDALTRDDWGRHLDRLHDIDGCNEYRPWHLRKKRI